MGVEPRELFTWQELWRRHTDETKGGGFKGGGERKRELTQS